MMIVISLFIKFFSQVESCLPGDVTWGLGYDSTAWVYTGGWGGGHFKVGRYNLF